MGFNFFPKGESLAGISKTPRLCYLLRQEKISDVINPPTPFAGLSSGSSPAVLYCLDHPSASGNLAHECQYPMVSTVYIEDFGGPGRFGVFSTKILIIYINL